MRMEDDFAKRWGNVVLSWRDLVAKTIHQVKGGTELSQADMDDIIADVFEKLMSRGMSLEHAPCKVIHSEYIKKVSRTTTVDWLRRRSTEMRVMRDLRSGLSVTDQYVLGVDMSDRVYVEFLKRIQEERLEDVYFWKRMGVLKDEEIAGNLGTSKRTVTKHWCRIRDIFEEVVSGQ